MEVKRVACLVSPGGVLPNLGGVLANVGIEGLACKKICNFVTKTRCLTKTVFVAQKSVFLVQSPFLGELQPHRHG